MSKETETNSTSKTKKPTNDVQKKATVRLRGKKRMLKGIVVSTKMNKTCVILIEKIKKHRRVAKNLRYSRKMLVHDAKQEVAEGDLISVISCAPISKHKFYRFYRLLEKGKKEKSVSKKLSDV